MKIDLDDPLYSDFRRTQMFLKKNARASRLPWFNSFPKNSCEPSSSYLARALEKRHPELGISIMKGSGSKGSHFWVEAGEYVMDLTVDPFDEYRSPIFDFAPHPSHELFVELERLSVETAWTNLGTGCQDFLNSLLRSLETSDPIFGH